MITVSLDAEVDAPRILRAVDGYRARVSAELGLVASETMRNGMRVVTRGALPSPPGGFPYARSGKLRNRIGWAVETDGDVLVGPELATPPPSYEIAGGATIPEVLNRGGKITIRRRAIGRDIEPPKTMFVKPRPYVDLTLEIVARRAVQVAGSDAIKD